MNKITLDEILKARFDITSGKGEDQAVALLKEWVSGARDVDADDVDAQQELYTMMHEISDDNAKDLVREAFKKWDGKQVADNDFKDNSTNNQSSNDNSNDTDANNNQPIDGATSGQNGDEYTNPVRWRHAYWDPVIANADNIELMFAKTTLNVYHSMGLIGDADFRRVQNADVISIDRVLAQVSELNNAQELEFSERFVMDIYNEFGHDINGVVPGILASAYRSLKTKVKNGTATQQQANMLDVVRKRIDELTDQFALFHGNSVEPSVHGQGIVFNFVDTTNIADSYAGYDKMFAARMEDFQNDQSNPRNNLLQTNRAHAQDVMNQYDKAWGLDGINNQTSIDAIDKHWADLSRTLAAARIRGGIMGIVSNYKFLDANGNVLSQFVNANGVEKDNYEPNDRIIAKSRLNQIIDLARQDVIKAHLAKTGEQINPAQLESEFNDRILTKLFEIDTVDKIRQGVLEDPYQFTDPKFRTNFINQISQSGGQITQITDAGYQAALQAQVNQTAGFATRLKSKITNGADRVGTFCVKLFEPIQEIDQRGIASRFNTAQSKDVSPNSVRIEMFKRILKGFASAFLVSAALTTIATAAAATAGVSLAVSMATIGVITALGVSYLQIQKWRRNQRANGLPDDFRTLLRDKRMLVSLGTTGLAAFAMVFGAAGFAEAAMAMGYGALAIGGSSNALQAFKDARNGGLGRTESVVWAVANAAAVVVGGIAGRTTAQNLINAYNSANPTNTEFQEKTETTESKEITHTETRTIYTQEALDHAKHITEQWYADNPQELQHRIELIEQYNAEHGTNIDPHRAVMLNADAGGRTFDHQSQLIDNNWGVRNANGNHFGMTPRWIDAHPGITTDHVRLAANLFNPGGLNPEAMQAIQVLDGAVSPLNELGYLNGVPVLTNPDYHMINNYPGGGHSVYADGVSPYTNVDIMTTETVYTNVENYQPVDVPAVGMFGQFFTRIHNKVKNLRNSIGSFFDKVFVYKKSEQEDADNKLPVPDDTKDKNKLPVPDNKDKLPVPDNKDKLPVPVDEKEKERIEEEAKKKAEEEAKKKAEEEAKKKAEEEARKKAEEEAKKKAEEEAKKKAEEEARKKAAEEAKKRKKQQDAKVYDCQGQKTVKKVDVSGYTHFRNFGGAEVIFRNVTGLQGVLSFEAERVNGRLSKINVHITRSDISNITGYRGAESLNLVSVKVHDTQSLDFSDTPFVTIQQTDLTGVNKFVGQSSIKFEQNVTGLRDTLYFGKDIKDIDLSQSDLSAVNTIHCAVYPKLPDNWKGSVVINGRVHTIKPRQQHGVSASNKVTKEDKIMPDVQPESEKSGSKSKIKRGKSAVNTSKKKREIKHTKQSSSEKIAKFSGASEMLSKMIQEQNDKLTKLYKDAFGMKDKNSDKYEELQKKIKLQLKAINDLKTAEKRMRLI